MSFDNPDPGGGPPPSDEALTVPRSWYDALLAKNQALTKEVASLSEEAEVWGLKLSEQIRRSWQLLRESQVVSDWRVKNGALGLFDGGLSQQFVDEVERREQDLDRLQSSHAQLSDSLDTARAEYRHLKLACDRMLDAVDPTLDAEELRRGELRRQVRELEVGVGADAGAPLDPRLEEFAVLAEQIKTLYRDWSESLLSVTVDSAGSPSGALEDDS
jgi:hypothetical protein